MKQFEKSIVPKLLPLKDIVFEKVDEFYKILRKYLSYKEVLMHRLTIFKCVFYELRHLFNLMDEAAKIEDILKIQIDVTTCSVAKYYAYRKRAKEKQPKPKKEEVKTKKKLVHG